MRRADLQHAFAVIPYSVHSFDLRRDTANEHSANAAALAQDHLLRQTALKKLVVFGG
jgi:hypothetical protein